MCEFHTTINVHAIWHTKDALLGRYGDMSVPPSLPQKKKYMHVHCSGPEIESGGFWHSYMYMYMSDYCKLEQVHVHLLPHCDITKFWEGGSLLYKTLIKLFLHEHIHVYITLCFPIYMYIYAHRKHLNNSGSSILSVHACTCIYLWAVFEVAQQYTGYYSLVNILHV